MKTRRMLILLALLIVLCGHEAQGFYNASTGRWLNRDPIGEGDGPNLCQYVRNRSTVAIDWAGKITVSTVPTTYSDGSGRGVKDNQLAEFTRALLCTIAAEVVGLLVGALLLTALVFFKRDPRMLLEQRTPFTQTSKLGEVPDLPLSSEAVGVALPHGKFYPIMFLQGRPPERGYRTPLLTVSVGTDPLKLKVYRGTNELATANHFLGEFQISGYFKTKQSLQLMIIFDVEMDQRLFLQVRDVDTTHNKALKMKRVATSQKQ